MNYYSHHQYLGNVLLCQMSPEVLYVVIPAANLIKFSMNTIRRTHILHLKNRIIVVSSLADHTKKYKYKNGILLFFRRNYRDITVYTLCIHKLTRIYLFHRKKIINKKQSPRKIKITNAPSRSVQNVVIHDVFADRFDLYIRVMI